MFIIPIQELDEIVNVISGRCHDLPKRTGTDQNGPTKIPKRTSMGTGTDFSGYRNGAEQTSAHIETNLNGNQKG